MRSSKKILYILVSLSFIAFSIQSCKTVKNNNQGLIKTNMDGVWELKTLDHQNALDLFKGEIPTLNFNTENKTISGYGGCNTYGSKFEIINLQVTIGSIMSTRVACSNLEAENKFTNLLSGTSTIDYIDGKLYFSKDGKTTLIFEKK